MKTKNIIFKSLTTRVYWLHFLSLGFSDLVEGLLKWRFSYLIGSADLRRRYARSRIGQFWLTLSTGISILIMAFIWALIFKTPIAELLPHMATSIILWQFIAGTVADAANLFTVNGNLMLSQRIPGSVIVYASVYRNILILMHNLVIIPIIFLVFSVPVTFKIILIIPALVLVTITSIWVSYIVGIMCSRFRDLTNILNSIMQLAFYVTPVIWKPGFMRDDYQWVLLVNPFTYFINILRAPILGEPIEMFNWGMAIFVTFGGLLVSIVFIGKYRRQLMYWV